MGSSQNFFLFIFFHLIIKFVLNQVQFSALLDFYPDYGIEFVVTAPLFPESVVIAKNSGYSETWPQHCHGKILNSNKAADFSPVADYHEIEVLWLNTGLIIGHFMFFSIS
jgi:hypothetical protein